MNGRVTRRHGWQVAGGTRSWWMNYHSGRGCRERMIESRDATLNETDGEGGRRRRNRMIQKTTKTGGAGRLKLLTISGRV